MEPPTPVAPPERVAEPPVGHSLQGDWAAAVAEAPPPPPRPEPVAGRAAAVPGALPASRPPPLPRSSFGLRRPGARASTPPGLGGGEGREREGRSRVEIPPDAEFSGELLRQVRESYGLSLQQVSDRTRITRIHLENVEADRYESLPATVYLRGILVNLARELRLDPARVSKSYLLLAQRAQARGP